MEFVLLLVCSIIIARFLEKKYRIASVLHAILFVVMFSFYMFSTNLWLLSDVAKFWAGEYYEIIHSALTDSVTIVNFSFSAFLVVELSIFAAISMIVFISLIKGFKRIVRNMRVKTICDLMQNYNHANTIFVSQNYEPTYQQNYLIYSKLRN